MRLDIWIGSSAARQGAKLKRRKHVHLTLMDHCRNRNYLFKGEAKQFILLGSS